MQRKFLAVVMLLTLPMFYWSAQNTAWQIVQSGAGTPSSAYAEAVGMSGWERIAYDVALAAVCSTTGAGWLVCVAVGEV